jgi:hypothetical protein
MTNSRSIMNKNPISAGMEVARQNPLATVLIGAGCMLLLAEKIRVSPRLPLRRGADSRTGRRLRGYTRASIQEHPLVCLAAGAAFGAAVAALLPATDVENELLGPAADSLKQKLADAVSEQYQAAKAEAGKAAQEFVWVAAREGLAAVRGASANVSDTGAEVTKSM